MMIINHNISALNTHRQLGANNNNVQGSLEKLSSGLKINRAGDDAAGLAISEKMRGQIRGLDMAAKNANDGISLIQTAEGALNETHDILQRMRELAVQSSNDTNTDADRAELQNEVNALAEELTRIADNTEFNTQNLLGGKFEATFHIGANQDQNLSISVDAMDSSTLGVGVTVLDPSAVAADVMVGDDEVTLATKGDALLDDKGNLVAGKVSGEYYAAADLKANGSDDGFELVNADAKAVTTTEVGTIVGETGVFTKSSDAAAKVVGNVNDVDSVLQDAKGNTVAVSDGSDWYAIEDIDLEATTGTLADSLRSGAEKLDVSADGIILGDSTSAGIDISSQKAADAAITTIQGAIDTVSSQRSELGAVQNRLEHTINNLGASSENLTAAESRIRDVDMAKEMMNFTKNNILTQASQAMLAQAQQSPQGVLQLLQ